MTQAKPTALHKLHGTGHPTRMKARKNEPVPPDGDITTPPVWMSEEMQADWRYAVQRAPAGVIFPCDRGILEVYIVAAMHHRIAVEEQQKLDAQEGALKLLVQTNVVLGRDGKPKGGGNVIMSPYLGIISSSAKTMMRAASELGFTPAARPRMAAGVYDPSMVPPRASTAPTKEPGAKRQPPKEPTGRDLDRLMQERETLN